MAGKKQHQPLLNFFMFFSLWLNYWAVAMGLHKNLQAQQGFYKAFTVYLDSRMQVSAKNLKPIHLIIQTFSKHIQATS